MLKVQIQATCLHCTVKAFLPMGEDEDCQGHKYICHIPCPFCDGTGNKPKWIALEDFAKLMQHPMDICFFGGIGVVLDTDHLA
jgi:hypothetical protein